MVSTKNQENSYQDFVNDGVDEMTKTFYNNRKQPVIFE
jgi:hypothetical protein